MDHDKAHGLIKALPKAELHLHIEGSLEPEMLFDLAQRNHVAIPYATVEDVRAAYNFHSLQSFLDLYYQGMSVLQTERDFEDLSYAYTKRMHAEHVRHSEPFFDPQGHLCRGISMKTVYNGLMAGFKKGEAEFGISIHLIFSFLRHTSEEECMEFIQQKNEDGDFIRHLFATGAFVAVGLDSTEVGNPPTKFKRLYEYCRAELKVPMAVAHAGEEGPASFIWDSLNILHVNRIDHGVACRHDEKLRAHLKETQMPLTVCPLSNVELKVFATRKDAAVATIQLLHEGLCVTINSDDPAYFGGYVEANYAMLLEAGNVTAEDLTQLAKNSFTASFLPEVTKAKYVAEIDAAYAKFKSA